MLPIRNDEQSVALSARDPFADLFATTRGLTSLMDQMWSRAMPEGVAAALADVEETDREFVVEVELPGVKKGDVDVALDGRRLTITAERKERERVGVLRHRTRHVGSYRFDVVLPAEIAEDGVSAELHDGVLTVHVPKAEAAQRRRIEVK